MDPRYLSVLLVLLLATPALARQNDDAYGEKILEYTTDERFVNEWVDHLPASDTVPSPLDHFGTIVGAPGILHYTSEIYGYFRALADASPHVAVRSIGRTEEDREMIEVIVADRETMQNLDTYRRRLDRLADPRTLAEADANDLIREAKLIYYVTAGLHSPETGSPEMVMELAYRLAVSDDPMIRHIRENVIFIFTPVAEPDGRDRIVDAYKYRADHRDVGPGLTYWGRYVAHDNNRDGYGLSLALTRNILDSFLHWKPQVMHDLHESVSYLYTSTGLGPYNEYIDPITIDEWHSLAYEEVGELTRRDMPGVWTHAFYNGWAANYLIWIANLRNSTGRFYETFGNSIPETVERELSPRQTSREWYRSNPPLEKAMWSLRNNTNYMQSGLLAALRYTADNGDELLENFYLKSKRAVEKGRNEAPHAWVILPPEVQARPLGTAHLVNLLMRQGLEVHEATAELTWSTAPADSTEQTEETENESAVRTAPEGSFVVRLDQPYRTLAMVLLDRQNFPPDEDPPYDDSGWTLPYLHQVTALKVGDPDILDVPMRQRSEPVRVAGGLYGGPSSAYLVNHTTDDNVALFRFRLGDDVAVQAAEDTFSVGSVRYNAGSYVITAENNPGDLADRLGELGAELGIEVRGIGTLPDIETHAVEVPRVGLIHTWVATPQDAGWWRIAFDIIGIPYTYLSEQDLATEDLSGFDVLILPRIFTSPQTLVAGTTDAGDPVPWRKTDEYPHIGSVDETDDQRDGMGYDGVRNLKSFVENGGVFITEGSTASFPIDFAITRRISIHETPGMTVSGSVLRADIADRKSPIAYGYNDTLAVYFSRAPVFRVNENVGGFRMPDWMKDELWLQEVPRVVVRFAERDLLMSGMAKGENAMAGSPAVVDVPVGKGHVILFANRPMRRWSTHGSHALVFNTMLHWNDLHTGWPERPSEDGEDAEY